MTTTTEPTVHPGWCNASECVEYENFSDVDHRTIPRPIAMDYVTGTVYLSGWAANKDAEISSDQPMVHAQLKSVELAEELLLMLSIAEARTLAAELLVLAETAEGGGA
jgi:hypothetical protein